MFGLIVWCLPFGEPHGFARCLECRYQVEPATASLRAALALRASGGEATISEGGASVDPAAKLLTEPSQMASPAEMARRYGPDIPVPNWRDRLVCSRCGSRRRRLSLRGS